MAAWAAESTLFATIEAPSFSSSPLVTVGYVIQLLLSLLVVFLLIYVSAKYLLPKLQPKSRSRYLEVLDRLVMEPQVTAYVLKFRSKSWVVVISNKQVTRLDAISEELG